MSQNRKPSLFFIVSPKYKVTAIENFLKRRDYDVFIEMEMKSALLRLIEVQPDFVFIALDHTNSKIEVLPQIIEQCVPTIIIPFIHSSSKEAMLKLDNNNYINKIFPPLSGPAVERMTIKLKADSAELQEKRSKHSKNLDIVVNGFVEQLSEKQKLNLEEKKSNKEHIQEIKEKNSFFSQAKKTKISDKQKENLKNNFQSRIKSDLADILETCQHEPTSNLVALNKEQKTIFCLLVQSKEWSGHLMAYSNTHLERHLLEPVFKNWISQEFQFFNEKESHVFFEIEINLSDFKVWVENKAEYFETLKVQESELMLSFVGIEPRQLLIEFDEESDLIDVNLEWVPLKTELNLSLFLHLPENKKYLLYTPKGQHLTEVQKQRLNDNKVEKLHSPAEFEEEVKKLKMIQYFTHLFSDPNRNDPEK